MVAGEAQEQTAGAVKLTGGSCSAMCWPMSMRMPMRAGKVVQELQQEVEQIGAQVACGCTQEWHGSCNGLACAPPTRCCQA